MAPAARKERNIANRVPRGSIGARGNQVRDGSVMVSRQCYDPHPAARSVTKSDIIDRVAHGTGLTRIETEAVVNGFLATVVDALKKGEGIEIRGFGSFKIQHRKARTARNPQTNEEIDIDARYVPIFKASKELRQVVDEAVKARRKYQRER
jgi:nucleoid DNA-binding protein